MIDYEMSSPEDPMPLSLNRFIQFCGVRYQKVFCFPGPSVKHANDVLQVEDPDSSRPG